jgi:hypothetical protein
MRITGSSRPSTTAVVGSIDMVVEAGVWEEEEKRARGRSVRRAVIRAGAEPNTIGSCLALYEGD